MPRRIVLELTEEQRAELYQTVLTHKLAYMRERAAAVLKVANGESVKEVAARGLLLPRDLDSLYFWIRRYQAEGVAGLVNKEGRGRKPAFSPSGSEQDSGSRPRRGRPRSRSAARGSTGASSTGASSAGTSNAGASSAGTSNAGASSTGTSNAGASNAGASNAGASAAD